MNKTQPDNSCSVIDFSLSAKEPSIDKVAGDGPTYKRLSWVPLAASVFLASCSTPQKTVQEPPAAPEIPTIEVTPIATPTEIVSINPETERNQALKNGDWWTYLRFSNELWLESDPRRQAQIEHQVWKNIRFLDAPTLRTLIDSPQTDLNANEVANIQAWAELVLMTQSTGFQQLALRQNLLDFHQHAPFHKHLFAQITEQLPKPTPPQMIAVLLPETGKFKVVGEFIKKGIIKSYFTFANAKQPIRLKFYDSADLNNIIPLYYQAKQEGADFIIGPVQKQAIELLSGMDDPKLLALNTIEQTTVFSQFDFKNDHLKSRLLAALQAHNIQTLGVLSSNAPKQLAKANAIRQDWLNREQHQLVQTTYDDNALNYREALGQLLNEIDSRERKNTLRWIVGKPLDYFPRVRQDLDAILMLDEANRLAVFNPQFDFFQLQTPVFGGENLQVTSLKSLKPTPDLKGIRLLNPPYALHPENLSNLFEAFGWDSYLLAMQMHQLKNGGCLSSAKTGILSVDSSVNGSRIDSQLIWTQYSPQGKLEPYVWPQLKSLELQIPNNDSDQKNTLNALPATNKLPKQNDGNITTKIILEQTLEQTSKKTLQASQPTAEQPRLLSTLPKPDQNQQP